MKLKQFIQQETVLTAAAVLAVVSAFFVLPDAQYLGYIDLRTLAILFSLMTVMAGLRRQGFFDGLGRALLSRTHSTFQLTLVLVGLCFFGSMFITNDVSLLTFVPFTFVVLSRLGADVRRSLLVPVVCMQTIAANLGSMLTPIGNPQNLYLYGKSGMTIGGFVLLMLPYTLVSLLLLLAWAALVCRKTSTVLSADELVSSSASQGDQKIILLYLVLFAVCLLSVIRVLPYGIAFAAVLVCALFADPHTLRAVDYSLLLTFVAFFIFIGNLGRIPAFSGWLQEFLTGREVLVAVLASQVTSNVPAALLLSGFTAETQALIIGTNLGGLGTLIASMASLISYRQIARELPQGKKQYFGLFTLSNLIFLAILLGGGEGEMVQAARNILGSVSGMICDGAKEGCASKVALSAGLAVEAACLALEGGGIHAQDGILDDSFDRLIAHLGELVCVGMGSTNSTIVHIMKDEKGYAASC